MLSCILLLTICIVSAEDKPLPNEKEMFSRPDEYIAENANFDNVPEYNGSIDITKDPLYEESDSNPHKVRRWFKRQFNRVKSKLLGTPSTEDIALQIGEQMYYKAEAERREQDIEKEEQDQMNVINNDSEGLYVCKK